MLKRVMTESKEKELTNTIIKYATAHQLTASNINDVARNVVSYMNDNAVLAENHVVNPDSLPSD